MIRRRRPSREIAFSFDSFLDVVANVVGIILRLILVAWVGARSYKAVVPTPPAVAITEEESVGTPPLPVDPLAAELPRRHTEIEKAHAKLQQQLDQSMEIERQTSAVSTDLAAMTLRRKQLDAERAAQAQPKNDEKKTRPTDATLAEMAERIRKVRAELEAVAKAPSAKQTLRYQTPLSQPVQTEELAFECHGGRITLIDVGTLLDDANRRMRDKSDLLRRQWDVEDDTRRVGAFRMHFVVERERTALEEMSSSLPPNTGGNFRYGISSWQVVPMDPQRGETAEQALTPGSAFRRVIDAIEPNQTAVTFWVYPDSFAIYRKVRDALHDRDVVVAGRPLPEGYPVAGSSRRGSVSRGQ